MSNLKDFLQSLGSADKDMLYQVFDSLNSDYSEYIMEIEEQMVRVKDAINSVNKRREFLSDDLAAVKETILNLNEFIEENDGDLVLNMLHYLLSEHGKTLSAGVKKTRPNELLDYKFDLKQKNSDAVIKQKLIESLLDVMSERAENGNRS